TSMPLAARRGLAAARLQDAHVRLTNSTHTLSGGLMKSRKLTLSLFAVLVLSLIRVQGSTITLTPMNPALLVGQTVQLTASGAVVPTAIATGAGHTCVLYTDQSIRCTGQNNQGEVGDGG